MTPGRAAAYIGGAVLLAAWLSSAATSLQDAEPPRPAPRAEATSGNESIAADVQAQAARLRTKLAAAPIPHAPTRNPFAFAMVEVPRLRQPVRGEVVPAPVEPATVEIPDVPLTLVGVAEQQSAKGVVRTAMIVGLDEELFLVTEGQEVAGRYRVGVIAADAVELKDALTGAIRRLALR